MVLVRCDNGEPIGTFPGNVARFRKFGLSGAVVRCSGRLSFFLFKDAAGTRFGARNGNNLVLN